jgi:hypothetical protein
MSNRGTWTYEGETANYIITPTLATVGNPQKLKISISFPNTNSIMRKNFYTDQPEGSKATIATTSSTTTYTYSVYVNAVYIGADGQLSYNEVGTATPGVLDQVMPGTWTKTSGGGARRKRNRNQTRIKRKQARRTKRKI